MNLFTGLTGNSIFATFDRIWGTAASSSAAEALTMLLIGILSVAAGVLWKKRVLGQSNVTDRVAELRS